MRGRTHLASRTAVQPRLFLPSTYLGIAYFPLMILSPVAPLSYVTTDGCQVSKSYRGCLPRVPVKSSVLTNVNMPLNAKPFRDRELWRNTIPFRGFNDVIHVNATPRPNVHPDGPLCSVKSGYRRSLRTRNTNALCRAFISIELHHGVLLSAFHRCSHTCHDLCSNTQRLSPSAIPIVHGTRPRRTRRVAAIVIPASKKRIRIYQHRPLAVHPISPFPSPLDTRPLSS